jgi:hypothetical protein
MTMRLARMKWIPLAICAAGLTVACTMAVSYASVPASPASAGATGASEFSTFTGSQPQAAAPLFLKGWGQPIDPDGDCSINLKDGRLTIKVPSNRRGHGLEAELNTLNAPRVLRDIDGDFIADLEMEGAFKPVGPSANPDGFPFVGAGLLLWSDDGNYIRLERAAIVRDEHLLNPAGGAGGQDEQLVPYILFQERRDRRVVPPDPGVPVPDGPIFLRLERKKDQIMAAVSVDGHGWRAFPPRTVRLPAKLKLGVAAISSSSEPFTVTLTNFRVLRPD